MTAESDSVFRIDGNHGERMVFCKNSQGTITQINYRGGFHPKMTLNSYDQSKTVDYSGDYFSKELSTVFSVILEKGNLYLKHQRIGKLQLDNIWDDDFKHQWR